MVIRGDGGIFSYAGWYAVENRLDDLGAVGFFSRTSGDAIVALRDGRAIVFKSIPSGGARIKFAPLADGLAIVIGAETQKPIFVAVIDARQKIWSGDFPRSGDIFWDVSERSFLKNLREQTCARAIARLRLLNKPVIAIDGNATPVEAMSRAGFSSARSAAVSASSSVIHGFPFSRENRIPLGSEDSWLRATASGLRVESTDGSPVGEWQGALDLREFQDGLRPLQEAGAALFALAGPADRTALALASGYVAIQTWPFAVRAQTSVTFDGGVLAQTIAVRDGSVAQALLLSPDREHAYVADASRAAALSDAEVASSYSAELAQRLGMRSLNTLNLFSPAWRAEAPSAFPPRARSAPFGRPLPPPRVPAELGRVNFPYAATESTAQGPRTFGYDMDGARELIPDPFDAHGSPKACPGSFAE